MNVLDLVRQQRPDVAPLNPRSRQELRDRLLGDVSAGETTPVATLSSGPNDSRKARTVGRFWLSIAAVIVIAVGLGALTVTITRRSADAPADQPAGPGTMEPPYRPDTVPVAASLPGSLVPSRSPGNSAAIDDVTAENTSPATTDPEQRTPFTPLALSVLPNGYRLSRADYVLAANGVFGFGVARYITDASGTQIELIVRDVPDYFDAMADRRRQSWDLDGRTVWSDGEADRCLPDVCSIGVQWDDHTAVTLAWVELDGGTLPSGSDQASLLALLASIEPQSEIWELTLDPIAP